MGVSTGNAGDVGAARLKELQVHNEGGSEPRGGGAAGEAEDVAATSPSASSSTSASTTSTTPPSTTPSARPTTTPTYEEDLAQLAANREAAEGGVLPGLCRQYYMRTCNRGKACPLMHGVSDSRFELGDISGVVIPSPGSIYPWTDGSASIVLDHEIDPGYVPLQKEVAEYAAWLGMDLETDGPLAWIAIEGLQAPVPSPWRSCKTDAEEIYFFNFADGGSSWDHPLDDHIRDLLKAEKEELTVRRSEARALVMAWRSLQGSTFPMLLKCAISFICPEPYPI